jgi:uncharacterized protein YcgL (UPF0745 family)
MNCCIYRSRKKLGSYLYITEKNNFSDIPDELFKIFGIPEFSFELELTESKKLARVDAKDVIASLQKDGFYLQMTPIDENDKAGNPNKV